MKAKFETILCSLVCFIGLWNSPLVSLAQSRMVSDFSGGGIVYHNIFLLPDGKIQAVHSASTGRCFTLLEFSLRNEGVLDQLLELKPETKKKIQALTKEYQSARNDPSQQFLFDPRLTDTATFMAESPAWQQAWRTKLEQVLDTESLQRLDQATTRWMFNSLGLQPMLVLHHYTGNPFLGMSSQQQRDIYTRMEQWRTKLIEENQAALQKHWENVAQVLTASQMTVYEQDYAPYLLTLHATPVEVVLWQLTLQKSDALVIEKLGRNPEFPDAWLSLPNCINLKIDGRVYLDPTSGPRAGDQKLALLQDLHMSNVLELSSRQMDELLELKNAYEQARAEENREMNRKMHAAFELHGIDWNNPYHNENEQKIQRDIVQVSRDADERRAKQLARDIDQILVPKQVEFLNILAAKSELRVFGLLNCLRFGRLGAELSITERQQELLARLQEREQRELTQRAGKMYREILDQWLEFLTEEQREEWEKLVGPETAEDFFNPTPNLLFLPTGF